METGGMNQDLNFGETRAASDMLEDALQHFDHIIDGSTYENMMYHSDNNEEESFSNNLDFESGLHGVAMLMEDLRNAVETTVEAETGDAEDKSMFSDALLKHISYDTLEFYRKLLKLKVDRNETESEKVRRLQNENEMLTLQVSVLTDQIEVQTDKQIEVEAQLAEANVRLEGADSRVQEEVAAKTNLETEKLHLMNELSNYKLELVQKEQEKRLENEDLIDLERKNVESETRNAQYKERIEELEKVLKENDKKIQDLEKTIMEIEKSKVVPKLMSPDEGIVHDHVEKQDPKLLQLRMPQPFATSTPISNEQPTPTNYNTASEDKGSTTNVVSADNDTPVSRIAKIPAFPVRTQSLEKLQALKIIQVEPKSEEELNRSGSTDVLSTSTDPASINWTPTSTKSPKSSSTPNLAMTEIKPIASQQEAVRGSPTAGASPFHQRKKHGFRKFFTSFRLRRSRSSQINVENENHSLPSKDPHDEDNGPSMFVRGGVRSTAGPRLQWNLTEAANKFQTTQNENAPFCRWDCDRVCQWLIDIGLPMYVENCKKWVKTGDTLLRATSHELEKELEVRHPLHKKKLMLHLGGVGEKGEEWEEGADKMNSVWVARWLDDIGLPQYKDSFHEACIDGRTLHHLTVSEAHKLKINNLVHLLSLRRAIQVLRTCNFDPTLLHRRPVNEGVKDDVSLWTNHRVMEWLRSVDLAEYASNLRGSGVHGALLVTEPYFTAETLASLLHMPMNKSLLRRHLAAKLDELLPNDFVKIKKEKAAENGYHALNVNVKYKIGRRPFGGLVRLRGASSASNIREFGSGEYVCPMTNSSKSMARHRTELETKMQMQGLREKRLQDGEENAGNNDSLGVVELNESTTREINAFSSQINSLTNNWSQN